MFTLKEVDPRAIPTRATLRFQEMQPPASVLQMRQTLSQGKLDILVTTLQDLRSTPAIPENDWLLRECINTLNYRAQGLPDDIKVRASHELAALIVENSEPKMPMGLFREYLGFLTLAGLPDFPPALYERLLATRHDYSLNERIALTEHSEHLQRILPFEFFDFPRQSPAEIFAQRDSLKAWDILLLDREQLTPEELTALLAITRERDHEVGLYYHTRFKLLFYSVGDGGGTGAGISHLRSSFSLTFHTHPSDSRLADDDRRAHAGDRESFQKAMEGSVHAIGKYHSGRFTAQVFNRDGKPFGKRMDLIKTTETINGVINANI